MPFFDKDGNEIQLDASNPELKSILDEVTAAAVREATSGLAANKDEILGEKKALQEKLDAMSEQWKGLDPEAVRTIMTRLENDEEARLLAEGKTDEVIERRTERLKADHAKQIAKLESALAERDEALTGSQTKVKSLMVEGGLRAAASELGLIPSAVDDALARANSVFKVNDEGNLIAEKDGATVFGKDGKSPMTPAEWLADMKEAAPHWFPAPSGGGAGGGNGNGGGKFTITREQARDVQAYRAAKESAEKAGASLQIVG
jgi:hypothetical protein